MTLRKMFQNGRRTLGTLVVSESPLWPRAIATTGLDFVFIDTEHISLDASQLAGMFQAYRGLDLPPIVRIPSPDAFAASKMLDIGAAGLVAPYIETPEQAKELVGAVRYRPIKGARLQSRLDGLEFEPELENYISERNASNILVLNIESVPAVESLTDILAVGGIDAVLVGPHDLSCSLGIPEQYEHPDFLSSCQRIFQTARAHNVGAGIHLIKGELKQQLRMFELGANLLIHSADILLATKHLKRDLAKLREALGDAQPEAPEARGEVDAI